MANIKIIDLPTGSPESDSFLEATQVNEQAESGRSSAKVAFNTLGNWISGQDQSPLQYNGLNTDSDTLIGAINELLVYVLNIADEYDPAATYDVDDYCIYQGVLYKCTTAITVAEAWNSAHWTSTLIVDEFGTGGGASVTLGTTIPSDASGSNGDLYVQYDSSTYAVVDYFVKINGSWRKAPYSRVVALTQAQYDLITPDPTTLYIITDAQSSYQTKSDNSLDTGAKTVVGAINELHGVDGYDVYDETRTSSNKYVQGDICIHSDSLQVCTDANGAYGAWDSSKWSPTTIKALLALKQNQLVIGTNYDDELHTSSMNPVTNHAITTGIRARALINVQTYTQDATLVQGRNRFTYTFNATSGYTQIGCFVEWNDSAIASTNYQFSWIQFGNRSVFVDIVSPDARTGGKLKYTLLEYRTGA